MTEIEFGWQLKKNFQYSPKLDSNIVLCYASSVHDGSIATELLSCATVQWF